MTGLALVSGILAALRLAERSGEMQVIETSLWGGLFLTLVIAVTGIVASLPIGVMLALGRRSNMPVVKAGCVVFIEIWRGDAP